MFPFKRVLVSLDLTEMDDTLIAYASYLTTIFDIDSLYFFHVARNLELPEQLLEKYPDLLAPADESIEEAINSKIKLHYKGNKKCQIKIEVREGNAEDKILRWSEIKEIDLIIMGRKHNLKGSGLLPGKMAKIGHCSFLIIPEKSKPEIKKIMVPVDFSKSSQFALDEGKLIAEKTKAKLIVQNTYSVPWGYHSTGKSYEEFGEIMKSHAHRDAIEFLKKSTVEEKDVSLLFSLDDNNEPSDKIHEEATKIKADLMIIASKGRTGLANILLGSVADKVLQYQNTMPILIVKDKKFHLGFLDALLKL